MSRRALDRETAVTPHQPGRRDSARPAAATTASSFERVISLQRTIGNRAATALLQRQVVLAAPPTRPKLETGDIDQAVGVLQQKLNVLGENLAIDAEFGG